MSTFKAIIGTGSRKLIGELSKRDHYTGSHVTVHNAYELRCDMFLLPTQQGPISIQQNNVVYLDAEESAVDIFVHIDNIRWFDEMEDRGLKYENMIGAFEDIMIQNRAQRAGISMARNVPKPSQSKLII
jgi:hypothetical protein